MKIGICQVNPTVGAINKNKHLVLDNYNKSVSMGAELVVFPELILSGYPPQDLLLRKRFLAEAADALDEIAKHSSVPIILGNTFVENNELFNCSFLSVLVATALEALKNQAFQHYNLCMLFNSQAF